MNSEIKKLMKTFKSKSKDKDKYNEFLYYCHQAFDSKKYKFESQEKMNSLIKEGMSRIDALHEIRSNFSFSIILPPFLCTT